MNNADKPAFAAVLSATMQTFNADMTAGMVDVWWNVLAKYELPAVRRALSDHIQDPDAGKWAPKPADIIGRLRVRPESVLPQLEHKREAPEQATLDGLVSAARPRSIGPYWTPEKIRNQQQVDFVRLQADHFGEFSAADRFLRECQSAGIITHDFRLGTFNTRQPGEDEIEHEEAA